MKQTMNIGLILLTLTLVPLIGFPEKSHAYSSYGSDVDRACQTFNGTTPFADQSCALCHASNRSQRQEPQWTWYQGGNLTAFCPAGNVAPVANAGPNQTVTTGTVVTLNGSGSSDVDGNPLTYSWSFVSIPTGSSATLTGPTTVKPTFLADKVGQYVARLVVNDGTVNSSAATVTITTTPGNTAPVPNAGPDQTVQFGVLVTLNGSGSSDVDGNPLTYQWTFVTIPTGSAAKLSTPTAVTSTFVADLAGQYVARLVVNDGTVNSTPDTVTITTMGGNTPPVAKAGPDQSVQMGTTVTLNGSGSTDADSNPLTYDWSFVSVPPGSTATLSNPTAAMPSFVADKAGQYVVQLIINDGTINSAPDTVAIAVASGNTAPVANAGPDQSVAVGATVILDGSASRDTDRNALSYNWALTAKPTGSAVTLSNAATAMPNFIADVAGQYVGQLIVNDGTVNSAPDTVTITAGVGNSAPVATVEPSQPVAVGATVTLDGSASRDADGNALTYRWAFMAKPTGSTATLSNPTVARPTFVADIGGEYVAQLIVNDGKLDSPPATAMTRALPMPAARGVYVARARWKAEDGKLRVTGRGPNGTSVEILDADTGTLIATGTTGRNGRYSLYVSAAVVPCAVEAKANGLVSDRAPVAGAPAACGQASIRSTQGKNRQNNRSLSEESGERGGKSLLRRNGQDR